MGNAPHTGNQGGKPVTLKQWGGVPPFVGSDEPTQNASSRVLSTVSAPTDIPLYRMSVEGTPSFHTSKPVFELGEWVEVTNTGRATLTGITGQVTYPFKIQGSIPDTLNVGESFKIRILFEPDEPMSYFGSLAFTCNETSASIDVQGSWSAYLRYDGSIQYTGKYRYNSLGN